MNFIRLVSMLLPALVIWGCNGSSSDKTRVEQAPLSPASLRPANGPEVAHYLRNAVQLIENSNVAVPVLDGVSADSNTNGGFSTTNVHVSGVDEADYVKYDGRYLYVAGITPDAPGQYYPNSGLRILSTDPSQAQATLLSELPFDGDPGWIPTLYLVSDNAGQTQAVAAINTVTPGVPFLTGATDLFRPRVRIDLYNVLNPELPSLEWTLAVDGYLRGSRKIGNMLYLISDYSPFSYFGGDLVICLPDGTLIVADREDLPADKLLPDYYVNGGPAQPLSRDETCLIPADTKAHYGNAWIVNITAVDLERRTLVDSICVAAPADGIYADLDTMYLGGSSHAGWNGAAGFTALHRFALNPNGIEYRATGVVPGTLPWLTADFFMDEHDGDLRVVTTQHDPADAEPEHKLFVLRERHDGSKAMDIAGQLPSTAHPQPLGKPGEDLYAVRFFSERAYAVTFRQIDPLYVIDLRDHEAPVIAGELEIPGFSTYLHPVEESLLFSVGQHVENGNRFKVALFDVADITQPREINSLLFGAPHAGSDTLYDLRALSFLPLPDNRTKVTIPIDTYDSHAGLHLFEINGIGSPQAMLHHQGVIHPGPGDAYYFWRDRGVIHEPSVYYIHNGQVWSAFWSQPDSVYGPD